jgi:hypothetical protein
MTITREQVEQLTRIYNTMLEIRTKGEDTLVMADCLRALEQVVTQIMQSSQDATAAPVEVSDNE